MATTLETTFAGLRLRNPIIVSSSGLTDNAAKNRKLDEAGAGAIVLKSLFEEQIMMEVDHQGDLNMYPEGSEYLAAYIRQHKLNEYLNLIKESKQACSIPIIASINCYSDDHWIDFARQIEAAGADALEINILALQADAQYTYGSFEQRHIDILRHVKGTVSIPVIMKLGDNLTNPVALIDQLQANGADAVVLFNRFYQPDIDIDKMVQTTGPVFSNGSELPHVLLDRHCLGSCEPDRLCRIGRNTQRRRHRESLAGRSLRSRDVQRHLPAVGLRHCRIQRLPQAMDGRQRHGKHRPVQRETQS